jgi:hypothetical protein
LPDSQAGHFPNFSRRLLPDSESEHNDSAHQRQAGEQRRNINVLVLVHSGVDRPYIQNFIPMRIVESLIGKGKTTQDDEENATPNERFHGDNRAGV